MKTEAIREAVRRLRGMNLYTLAAQVDAEADNAVEVTQALLAVSIPSVGTGDDCGACWCINQPPDGSHPREACRDALAALRKAGALP